jgi:hypothetical protein
MDWLKYLVPLVCFAFGVWFAPWIERRKTIAEEKEAIAYFFTEVQDYTAISKGFLKNLHECHRKITLLKVGVIREDSDFYPIILPSKVYFLSIDRVVEKAFLSTTPELRQALRSLTMIVDSLNSYTETLKKYHKKEDFDEKIIYSAAKQYAVFYYLVSRLSEEKERYKSFKLTQEEIIRSVLSALNLSFEITEYGKNVQK